jgi:hypothetical protein
LPSISDTLSKIDKSQLKIFQKFVVADLPCPKTSEIGIIYISAKKKYFDKRFFVSDTLSNIDESWLGIF